MLKNILRKPSLAVVVLALLLANGAQAFSQESSPDVAPWPEVSGETSDRGRRVVAALNLSPCFTVERSVKSAHAFFPPRQQFNAAQNTTNRAGQTNDRFTPLTPEEKLKYGLRRTFLSPSSYVITGVNAAITEASEEDQPQKSTEDRVADGLSRFAISFGTRSTKAILGSGVYPVLFKQDPRYRPSGKEGFGPRALYAASRVFVTHGDNGNLQPNFSRLGGTLTASALANVYERSTPGRDRIGVGPTFKRFGTSLGFDDIQFIVFREFGPDIKKLFGR